MTDKSQRKEDSDADGVAKRTSGGSAGGSAKKGAAGATGSAGGSATPAGSGATSHSKGGATTAGSGTTSHSKGGGTTAAARTYTVKAGDSLSKIAKEVYGDAAQWKKIYEANRQLIGSNPDLIKPGQVLTIPA